MQNETIENLIIKIVDRKILKTKNKHNLKLES